VVDSAVLTGGAIGADASQAAYFRGFLVDERMQVLGDLVQSRARLRECMERTQVVGLRSMARARGAVRDLEARQRELERLIAALDHRFAAQWAREG